MFFLLMALLKQVRPNMWIGENLDDIVQLNATQFADNCIYPAACEGVCVVLVHGPNNTISFAEVSPENPLDRCRHYMAAVPAPSKNDTARAATPFEEFMRQRNRMVQGTIGNGDCGLDMMCQMLSLPETQEARDALRIELRDYLYLHANEPWMWVLWKLAAS